MIYCSRNGLSKQQKECVFNIPRGVYTFEVILVNKEIYKKGEYQFDDDVEFIVPDCIILYFSKNSPSKKW